jgi:hypothetical protein
MSKKNIYKNKIEKYKYLLEKYQYKLKHNNFMFGGAISNFTEQKSIDHIIDNTEGNNNNQIVNFFLSDEYIKKNSQDKYGKNILFDGLLEKKTDGIYFSLWIKCNDQNGENGEIILGTGGYPQDKLSQPPQQPQQPQPPQPPQPRVFITIHDVRTMQSDEASQEIKSEIAKKYEEWYKYNISRDRIPVIIESKYISDRQDKMATVLDFIKICTLSGINYTNSHTINHIASNDLSADRLQTLNLFFTNILPIINCRTGYEIYDFIDKNLRRSVSSMDDVNITDYSKKYNDNGNAWIKGHFKVELIIRDRIMKFPAVIKLKPSDIIAIIR